MSLGLGLKSDCNVINEERLSGGGLACWISMIGLFWDFFWQTTGALMLITPLLGFFPTESPAVE